MIPLGSCNLLDLYTGGRRFLSLSRFSDLRFDRRFVFPTLSDKVLYQLLMQSLDHALAVVQKSSHTKDTSRQKRKCACCTYVQTQKSRDNETRIAKVCIVFQKDYAQSKE